METVTMFDNCLTKQCREVTWQEVYDMVRGEGLRSKTEAVRTMSAGLDELAEEERRRREKEVKRMKSGWFPGLMPACHCSEGGRNLDYVVDYTGFCQADFDHIPRGELEAVRARLQEVPEVMLMHTSMRGEGLHVFFRLSPAPPQGRKARAYQDTYVQGYRQGNMYLAEKAGVPYDRSLEPAVHLSCINYDPQAYFNPQATPFSVDMEHPVDKGGEPATAGRRKAKKKRRKRGDGDGRTKAEQIVEFLGTQPLRYDVLSRKIQIRIKIKNEERRIKNENEEEKFSNSLILDKKNEPGQWVDLTDRMANDLLYECNRALGQNISKAAFLPMLMSAQVPEVNPLREYIQGLPPWDGRTDYIAEVAAMVHVADESSCPLLPAPCPSLWETCFRKWLVAMVAGWMRDEVVNHQVLVLIGPQGIFKTSWLDALVPPQLAQYRSKQSLSGRLDKDELLRATEFGLINMDEIDRMSEADLNQLKSLITSADVNVRSPYAYGKERRLRVASYVASGNKERFLTDQTGNRRWLPFRVEQIESPFLHPLPYEGLYAQAWHLVQAGFNYWFDLQEIRQMEEHVEEFMVETSEAQLLPVYFQPCEPGTPGAQLLTVAEISAKLTLWGNIRRPMDVRQLGALLRKMGYVAKRNATNRQRGYLVLEYSADAINANRRIAAR